MDQTYGFQFRYRLGGGDMTKQNLLFATTETLTKGDMLNVETGEVDLGVSSDAAFAGIALETKAGTTSVTRIEVIMDEDAVYGVYDANARLVGATLDLSGATGLQTVTTSGDADFTVVAESTATEETLVRITVGEHVYN